MQFYIGGVLLKTLKFKIFAAVFEKNHYFVFWGRCEEPLFLLDEMFIFTGH
jgi:hypothetical protein